MFLFGVAGCAAPQTTHLTATPGGLPPRAEIAGVPFFPQDEYYCGPAALAMVLSWSGLPVNQDDLVPQVYTPGREGTFSADILSAARRNGRLAVEVKTLEAVLGEIAAGHPVLVFQNLALDWWPQWHFAVAVGYDLPAGQLVLRSGLDARRVTNLSTFEHTWRRGGYWAIVALPPGQLPATAGEEDIVRAAAALERVERPGDAARAYAAILKRWPESLGALMGLGNARYAEGDYRAAEAAFRHAASHHAEAPDPWNNLAYALIKQGRKGEALAAARKAVHLAGADSAGPYEATLKEIKGL